MVLWKMIWKDILGKTNPVPMKLFFTVLISLFAFHSTFAQERTISGVLTSTEDGSPLPGINIVIKGTNVGTTTDAGGYYSIRVPIGATLTFSFVGMQTREVVVTESNFQPSSSVNVQAERGRKRKFFSHRSIPPSLYKDSLFQDVGIAVLTDQAPTHNFNSHADPTTIRSIREQRNYYRIKTNDYPFRRTGFALRYTTSLGIEQINRLPSLQGEFAQGRTDGQSLQWIGADHQEIFSWGPLLRTLQFDGNPYPYDANGMLVKTRSGTGEKARTYNALSFFRTGLTNSNEVVVTMPARRNATFVFDLENKTRSGVIPNSRYCRLNVGAHLKNYNLKTNLSANGSVSYNRSTGTLLNRGPNLATIVGAVYRTPITFDNTNAQSPATARTSSSSYELSDGSKRSHAPGLADNPYGLIQELPDSEILQRIIGTGNLHYSPAGRFNFVLNGSIDQQWNVTFFGIPPGYSGYVTGRMTQRKDDQTFANSILTSSHRYNNSTGEGKFSLSYQTDHTRRELDRTDGFNFVSNESFDQLAGADLITKQRRNISRTVHEIIFDAQHEFQMGLNARITNRNYFSNTSSSKQFTNLFPSASLSIDFAELLDTYVLEDIKLYVTTARTIREAPLLYSNWSYQSTTTSVDQYVVFYEANELFYTKNTLPEIEQKFETGLKLQGNRITVALNYFDNQTNNFIAPVPMRGGFQLQNTARIHNYGAAATAGYMRNIRNGVWGTNIAWTKFNNLVEEIYGGGDRIALAGFQTVQTVLSPGQPAGAIYGTSYFRNHQGHVIIGADGFPLKDDNLKMIGNPIPAWTLGWSSYIHWKQFSFSCLMDFKKGGQIWNGTNNMLDYLGRSSNTGDNRNLSNYIFEGVDTNGNTNVVPVSFYDPARPLNENRWVRYGPDGVGEDYIEDASSIRISEIVLSYSSRQRWNNSVVKSITLSLVARNLLLFTPYSGVDPSATLFGYASGNGLDLFNLPSVRSYSGQITIKI